VRDWFYGHYQNRIKETTVSNRAYLLERHILQNTLFGNKKISKITASDIDAFYNQKIKEDYSTSYIRQMHQLLNQAFNQAVKWGKIVSNPVSDTDPPSVNYGEISIWFFDEIHLFLKACRGERHYLTFLLAIYTGMRRGEILGLKWCDVDFSNKRIHVNRSLAQSLKAAIHSPH
jgi:integrase